MWKHGMLCEQKGLEFKHLELEKPISMGSVAEGRPGMTLLFLTTMQHAGLSQRKGSGCPLTCGIVKVSVCTGQKDI